MTTIEQMLREGDRAALAALLDPEPEVREIPLPPSTATTYTTTVTITLARGLTITRTERRISSGRPPQQRSHQ